MRTWLGRLTVAALVVSTSATLPTPAGAAPAANLVELCKNAAGPHSNDKKEQNVGECVSLMLTLFSDGSPPHICKDLQERGLLDDIGYASFSACLREERRFIE